jgi:hypothetical protein
MTRPVTSLREILLLSPLATLTHAVVLPIEFTPGVVGTPLHLSWLEEQWDLLFFLDSKQHPIVFVFVYVFLSEFSFQYFVWDHVA